MVLTEEPTRAEKHLPFPGNWTFYAWDCAMGIRPAGSLVGVEDLRDPVEALNWLTSNSNTVLMTHNLHLFSVANTPEAEPDVRKIHTGDT